MKLSADFDDEWKKIGSKRQKFDDLGLPLPKVAYKKQEILIVKEADKESRINRINQLGQAKL